MGTLCHRRDISGLNCQMITDYIRYLGNLRCMNLGFEPLYPGYEKEPDSMSWISQYSNANLTKQISLKVVLPLMQKVLLW